MSDNEIPWILRHAAEHRGSAPVVEDEAVEDEAVEAVEAPASKFRRVSGAPTMAAAPVRPVVARRPAVSPLPPPPPPAPPAYAARTDSYSAPPSVRDWDAEIDTLTPSYSRPSAPSYTSPPPSSPSPSYGGSSPYAPTPRKKRGIGVIAGVVAGAVILGGGGVGGIVLLTKGSAPSRAEFVADADDVCRPANGPIVAIVKPTSYPEVATAAGTLTATIDGQLGQLRALDQPGGAAKAQVAGVFTALEGTSAAAKSLQDAAGRKDDPATIAATKDLAAKAADARTQATTTGFAACSVGMQPGIDAVFGGTQSVIKAGFVAQSDVLCRRASNSLEDIEFPADDSGPAFAAFMGDIIGVFETLISDIRALPVAPGDEATVDEILAAQSKVQAKDREMQDAAHADDFDRFDALQREDITLATAAAAKWDAYGIGGCGSNFGF